jgi:hypothetical protein
LPGARLHGLRVEETMHPQPGQPYDHPRGQRASRGSETAQRIKAQPEKFELRKTLTKHPFGTIKRWMDSTHFTLKGLEKVRAEWSLITLAYDRKRVLNLVSFQKLMAAVV